MKIKLHFKKAAETKTQAGFTLIELLVVIAIIGLLSGIAVIALQSARQKGRDAKRLGDMTQISTAMELYFNSNKGYPSDTADLVPDFMPAVVTNPQPADGDCATLTYPDGGGTADNFFYYPSPTGGSYILDSLTLYPDYLYYFCLGRSTGDFSAGVHSVTPRGVK